MSGSFCCMCGKIGKWPLCDECREKTEPVIKKKVKTPKISRYQMSVNRRRENYHECILQIRTSNPYLPAVIAKVIQIENKKRTFKVWQEDDDYYFDDIKSAKNVIREVVKRTRLSMTETKKMIGFERNKSKPKYKWTMCIRDQPQPAPKIG